MGSSRSKRSGSPASARASDARVSSPPEKLAEGAVELVVLEAEPVQGHERLGAPVPAAGVLEASLGGRVLLQHGLLFRPLRHLGLEVPQAPLEGDEVGAAGEHVVTQAQLGLARGPLVVQRGPRSLLEHELPAIGAALPGQHSKQSGLAGPVAARQRHAIAALELERDAPEQRLPRHVLVQRAGDHNGHVTQSSHTSRTGRERRLTIRVWAVKSPHTVAEGPTLGGPLVQALAGRHHGIVKRKQVREAGLTQAGDQRRHRGGLAGAAARRRVRGRPHRLDGQVPLDCCCLRRRRGGPGESSRGRQALGDPAGRASQSRSPRRAAASAAKASSCTARASSTTRTGPSSTTSPSPASPAPSSTSPTSSPRSALANAVHEAEVQRLFDLKQVERVLARLPGRKGRHKLKRVLAAYRDVQPFTRSRAERLVLRDVRGPRASRARRSTRGSTSYEVDFYWPDAALVLEFDGGAVHRTTPGVP